MADESAAGVLTMARHVTTELALQTPSESVVLGDVGDTAEVVSLPRA
ncbi:hypothetical protein AKJ09_10808 [Labilithrix luteola]|uniref:Uncharacterized protein n=1 Tax=Labilithrix luteola TaxID=1391654 RepID=A0A0K1QFD5_9BACT|nr:hypothetical protein AKJ09_10808 [Labilithrix luteola]